MAITKRTNAAGKVFATITISRKRNIDKNWNVIDAMLAAGVTITIIRKGR